MKVYFDFRDWWVGYYRGDTHHYVCPLPTLVIQTVQNFLQGRILTAASQNQFALPPWVLRTPILRDLPGRLIGRASLCSG